TQVYVLDETLRPVPVGVPGELFIGGDGLARGYLGQPALTAERFVPNPFASAPGARVYRSGDRVRWLADGTLQFLGRVDFQVKVRGFRIELGEVEAAVRLHPAVAESVAVVREDVPGDKRLVAYVTPGDVDTTDLRTFLKQKLPEYMVPSALVALESLPLSPNGKVDRKALPAPDFSSASSGTTDDGELTPLQQQLVALFREVLNVERVGRHDDFFELGGHSLLATQLVTRVRGRFKVELSLRAVFESPTVALLAEHLEALLPNAPRTELPPLVPVSREAALPLSFAQQRLWFLEQLQPGQAVYNVTVALRLSGPMNVDVLRRTFAEIVRRHEVLRTTFVMRDGEPSQRIHAAPAEWPLPVEDLSTLDASTRDAVLKRRMSEEAHHAFDLVNGPLLRTVLVRTAAEEHALLLTMHHIVSDGWSMGVLVREVAALYEALSQGLEAALPALPVQYADYAAWQRQVLEGEALSEQVQWWRSRLHGAPALELPTDSRRPAVRTLRGATHFLMLPTELVRELEKVAQAQGATLYMVLMAAWQALLARYSGQTDFCVGTPVAHRTRPELEGLIGFFVNTLALRCNLGGDPSFTELVSRVRDESLGAFAHQDVPFDRLVETLGGERDLSRTPIFQSLFVLQNAPMQPPSLPGMKAELLPSATETSKFDLSLSLMDQDGGLEGRLEYSLDLFTADTARRMAEHFQRLLGDIAKNAGRRLSELSLMSESERQQVLVAWNDTSADYPADATVHQLFTARARTTPDAVAVEFEGRTLTYAELDARSNQLARHLLSLNLGAEPRVGVCVARSLEVVVGLLGVLKAGGCYVPLDPAYPAWRLAFLYEDAGLAAVLTQQALVPVLPASSRPVVCLDSDWPLVARQSGAPVTAPAMTDSLAYVTYTSGSTGTPKGVAVPHRGVLRLLFGSGVVNLEPKDAVLQLTSLTFDPSTLEIWGALLHGARLVVYPPHTPDVEVLARLIIDRQVTAIITSTAVFDLMQQHQPEALARVTQLVAGGDVMPAPRVRERLALGRSVVNAYGPTESTTITTAQRLSPGDVVGDSVSIGRPIGNTQVYVLDTSMRPVPVGVPGELFIGGDGLARGYLGRPELTAERFVPHPFSATPGARLYRSGDRVRWKQDGTLEFLGRIDFQVKVRGFRIELGEVEAALRAHSAVTETVAVVREDVPGDKRLVAYVVPADVDTATLREHLRKRLPEHMVPSAFVALAALPLSSHGKVDRKALPAPDFTPTEAGFVEPQTPRQQQLAAVFREVLNIERVGLHDDFFLLGGHSLLATQVVTRLRAQLGVELPLRAFFEAPTVARLAERLDAASGTRTSVPLEPLPRAPGSDAVLEVSSAQQRLWFMDQLQPGQSVFNMPAALRLRGSLDVGALGRTFAEVVRRHETLRTTFVSRDGRPLQHIHAAPAEWPLPVEDLSALAPAAREAAVQRRMTEEAHLPFDLANGPLLRTVLLRSAADEHVLVLCMHHIVSDGWSMGVLVNEVAALYAALAQGREPVLPALPVQYADYAAWQRRVQEDEAQAAQLEWWRSRLDGAPVLELPTDSPRPAVRSQRGATHFFTLPAELISGLENVGRSRNATLFMVLMAGWQALLARYSGQRDFCVGTSVGHRDRPELEPLIGFFVNTLALRCRLDGDPAFTTLVDRVREEALGAFAHQDVPFERLVEELGGERDMSRTPLFQTLFVLLNAELRSLTLPGLDVEVLPLVTETSRYDLTLGMIERNGVMEGRLEYSLDLFTPDTARRMVEHLTVLLKAVAHGAHEQRLSELPLMSEAERQQVVVAWNDTRADYPADATIASLFSAQARRTPQAVAMELDGRTRTYAEVEARSNQLAHHLRSLGLGAESRIGVFLNRDLDLVVALLGILKAGGCYVPLDPSYPAQRL
ncbi:non-ribosomal peptide synthetase, partial [Myxococcus sp. RHSTA-1-4]|uniref:non-ribosomal peptide synthetase n=1 Tax=Myxococcus sp. RHSTA-1-4 TaxID=2874601 RepID=UPI001CBBF7CE